MVQQLGSDLQKAFQDALSEAHYESGFGGYSGTVAEKDSVRALSTSPLWIDEAIATANTLINSDDPRIADKWGPAGALAYCSPRRKVQVSLSATSVPRDGWDELIRQEVQLSKGEKIVSSSLCSSMSGPGEARATFDVTIERAQAGTMVTKTAVVTVDALRNSSSFAPKLEAALKAKLRLGGDVVVLSTRITDSETNFVHNFESGGVGRTTRYVITGPRASNRHDTFETGFSSLAEAKAFLKSLKDASGSDAASWGIEGIVRSGSGKSLATLTRKPRETKVTAEVTFAKGRPVPTEIDGWLIFGWASC